MGFSVFNKLHNQDTAALPDVTNVFKYFQIFFSRPLRGSVYPSVPGQTVEKRGEWRESRIGSFFCDAAP
jgi:hypothetical protein